MIIKADAKTAFFQTVNAKRDVYFMPLTESEMRSTLIWHSLTAVYASVNSNAKLQVQLDQVIFDIGLKQCQQIPQFFCLHENGKLVLVAENILNCLEASESGSNAKNFIANFSKKLDLGTVLSAP